MELITDQGPHAEDADGTRVPVGFCVLGFNAWRTEHYDGADLYRFDADQADDRLRALVAPHIAGRSLHIADDCYQHNAMVAGQSFTDLTPQVREAMDDIYADADLWEVVEED